MMQQIMALFDEYQSTAANGVRIYVPGWRRRRDSNPRYAINVYALSRGAPSAARPLLRILMILTPSEAA